MPVDALSRLSQMAQSAVARLIVRSALNPLLWMSATIGTVQPRERSSATMFFRLAASLTVGAVITQRFVTMELRT